MSPVLKFWVTGKIPLIFETEKIQIKKLILSLMLHGNTDKQFIAHPVFLILHLLFSSLASCGADFCFVKMRKRVAVEYRV